MDSQKQEFVLRRHCPFVHQNKHHYFIIYAALKSQSQKAIYITQSLLSPPKSHLKGISLTSTPLKSYAFCSFIVDAYLLCFFN
jgi:hypothetical protein